MRYTGPKWRINRREGYSVLGKTEKWRKRQTLPGQFSVLAKRPSDYAYQFREKQKVKRMYGMSEKQFVRFYKIALKTKGNSSTKLLQLLELRVDNVVYRLGFASTRAQARQMVTHGHILLNGKSHDIPSTIAKPGDEIMLKDSILKSQSVLENLNEKNTKTTPSWLEPLDKGGKVVGEPLREDIDRSIRENLIIELYSR